MKEISDCRGIWPVAPTPFTETGALDLPSTKRLLDCMIDQGVDGICILANFSEQFLLSDEERDTLTRACLEHIDGRVPVIVTASHFATDIVVKRVQQARALGAAMTMLMPPYHGALRGTPEQTLAQFDAVSAAGLPIMVQDAPISGVELSVDFLVRMAQQVEQVKYFKIECAQAALKIGDLVHRAADSIEAVLDGEEGITLLADMDAGAVGSVTSAMIPDLIRPAIFAYLQGDRAMAKSAYERLLPLINYENRQCGLRAAKAVLKEGGVIDSDYCRKPLAPLRPDVRKTLLDMAAEHDPLALTWGR